MYVLTANACAIQRALVKRIVEMAGAYGRQPATVAETRQFLRLPA